MSKLQRMVLLLDETKRTILHKGFQMRENSSFEEVDSLVSDLEDISVRVKEMSSRFVGRMQAD